jgi:phage host-nuclease inhibitor protein Gam
MEIDWRILVAGLFAIGGSHFFLLRTIREKKRQINRLEAENRQVVPELVRARGEHAQEIADLKEDYAKRLAALRGNVTDLTALVKDQNKSGWDGWLEKQK